MAFLNKRDNYLLLKRRILPLSYFLSAILARCHSTSAAATNSSDGPMSDELRILTSRKSLNCLMVNAKVHGEQSANISSGACIHKNKRPVVTDLSGRKTFHEMCGSSTPSGDLTAHDRNQPDTRKICGSERLRVKV